MLEDPNGNAITASFNAHGFKEWVDDPNMGPKSFGYSGLGEVLSETDANGDTVSMAYDLLGRMTERFVNGTQVGEWAYDNPASNKGLGLLDYEDSQSGTNGTGLRKSYRYSPASSGRKL